MNKSLLLLIVFSLIILSCSKKGGPSVNSVSPIAGKWYFLADTTAEYFNGTLTGIYSTNPGSSAYIQFNNDFTGTSQTSQGAPGDTDSFVAKFTYKLSGKTLIINYPPQKVGGELFGTTIDTGVIKSITGNELITQYSMNFPYMGGNEHYFETQYLTK